MKHGELDLYPVEIMDLKETKGIVNNNIPNYAHYSTNDGIEIKIDGLVLSWIDSEGIYKLTCNSIADAWKNFKYWCKSAQKGGALI